jgi:carboxymethylenebutenolidase
MVEFACEGRNIKGYFVQSKAKGKRPALIVIQEWWGLNDHIKSVAERFADEGYFVLAPDLYEGVSTKDAEEAGRLMQGLEQKEGLAILHAAVDFLKSQEEVIQDKIGVTGFCMGGTYALLLACHHESIKASAPFYGDVPADDVLENLMAPVLFIGAENDFWITKDKMQRLSSALTKFNKVGEVKIYKGVGHAFFNDTRPEAYDDNSAQDAWKSVNEFFRKYL